MTQDEHAEYDCSICLGVGLTAATLIAGFCGLLLAKVMPDIMALIIMGIGLIVAGWAVLKYCAAEYPEAGIVMPDLPELPTGMLARSKSDESYAEEADADFDDEGEQDYDDDGFVEGDREGRRPKSLMVPMTGGADDLKMIKGIGPRMQTVLNGMGYFHYAQIASWTKEELAWIDANLEGHKGRASRDNWVEQARVLADTGSAE